MLSTKTKDELGIELKQVRDQIDGLEKAADEDLKMMNRRRSVPFGTAEDWGAKQMVIRVSYDEFNVESFLTIANKVYNSLTQRLKLRERELMLQKEIEVKAIESNTMAASPDQGKLLDIEGIHG